MKEENKEQVATLFTTAFAPVMSYDITIDNKSFEPQNDITPLESVRISQLFTLICNTMYLGPDYSTKFITLYGLERHFKEQ
jgi:hypothetical protein